MLARLIIISVAAISAALAGPANAQTTITLRASARLAEDAQQVRLTDVADLVGPEAATLGELIVVDQTDTRADRDGLIRVDVGMVRAALDTHAGINWGKLTLRGRACTIRIKDPSPPGGVRAPLSADTKGRATRPVPVDLSGPATVRTAVATRLAAAYGVSIDHLRLGFDAVDDGVLGSLTAGRTVDIDLGASPGSARVPITVNLYSGESVVLSHTLQADVLVNRPVVSAAAAIERGRAITASDLSSVEQWVAPSLTPSPLPDELIGSIAQNRIAAGKTIERDDVAAPLACKRGDTVFVHCLSGSVIVKVKAKAMGQARDGETVQLKMEGSDEPFTARMSGKGRAVLITPGSPSGGSSQSVFGGEPAKPADAPRPAKVRKDRAP
jgi:flagella basal body P-ring formation protein FlgA